MRLFITFYRLFFILLISLTTVACVTNNDRFKGKEQHSLWQEHQQQLTQVTAFQATGSMAYFNESTKSYGRFFINQMSINEYQLKLTTPTGGLVFSLTVTPYLAELIDHDGNKYRDENVERLMNRLTGMDMPLSSLHKWLVGLSDNPTYDKIDGNGRLLKTRLSQKNQTWHLNINQYKTYKYANKMLDLPATIELTKQKIKLRLKIDNWKLN